MTRGFLFSLCFLIALTSADAFSASRRSNDQAPPPQIYKDSVKNMIDQLVLDESLNELSPLSEEQQEQARKILRKDDLFLYDTPKSLEITNHTIPISLSQPGIPLIKLGHTFNTTLIFTDAAGHPWTVDTLTDMSDSEVVSIAKKAPNIITVRPKKKAGKTNLPIKLAGQQRPITFLFDISDEEVYFDVDVQIDSMGDHNDSQRMVSVTQFQNQQQVAPRLNVELDKSLLLQFMTPEGYKERLLFDEHRKPVDPKDFMAWTKDGKLYLMTPHLPFNPDPIDYHASPDGRHRLLEFKEIPILAVRKNSKIFWLYVE